MLQCTRSIPDSSQSKYTIDCIVCFLFTIDLLFIHYPNSQFPYQLQLYNQCNIITKVHGEDCIGCVRLASLGRPGLPPVRSNSFDVIPGAHPGQPSVPCLWSGSLGGWPQVHDVTTRAVSDRSFSSCQGLTLVSTPG